MKTGIILFCMFLSVSAVCADTIYEQDFESGAMPADWEVWQIGATSPATWLFDQTDLPYEGTYYMFHGYDDSENLDNWVVTQTFDMTHWENISVSFWHCGSYAAYYTYTGLMASNANNPAPADFVEVQEIGAPPLNYSELSVDCTDYDRQIHVTFAWRYTGADGHFVRLDNLLIEGDNNPGIESASLGAIKAIYK